MLQRLWQRAETPHAPPGTSPGEGNAPLVDPNSFQDAAPAYSVHKKRNATGRASD